MGKYLKGVLEKNYFYNISKQHFINDEEARRAWCSIEPPSEQYEWNFRPDFPQRFAKAKELLGFDDNINIIDTMQIFNQRSTYTGSTFLMCDQYKLNCDDLHSGEYILFHYPTSTRPRGCIATFNNDDWQYINRLSIAHNKRIVVVTDVDFEHCLNKQTLVLKLPSFETIISLCKHAYMFVGCDSFMSILCSKVLSKEHMLVKTHWDIPVEQILQKQPILPNYYLPHDVESLKYFYRKDIRNGSLI